MAEMISKETILNLAKVSMLHVSDDEIKEVQQGLKKLLSMAEELARLDTENIEPLFSVASQDLSFYMELGEREDCIRPSLSLDRALKNAPKVMSNQFKVEAILNEDS